MVHSSLCIPSRRFITSLMAPAVCLLLSLTPGQLLAADANERAQAAIDTRQGLLKVVGSYLGPIVGMARDQIPYDAQRVADNATKIGQLANMIPDVFKYDTSSTDLDTEALDVIWENTEDFNAKAATVAKNAAALAAATKEGQGAAMKAFGALGGACKSCHDDFRVQQ